jgi:probable F420-dependent oxidoreductase
MQFGVALPQFGPMARGDDVGLRIGHVARAADRLGYDVLWTAEHVVFPAEIRSSYPYGARFPYDVTDPVLDVGTTLAWVAAQTERIRLAASVQVLPYHHPILFAKALASLDVLSAGRVMVGVAGGWLREEFEMLGVPFAERGARTDEYLALMKALWTDDEVTFAGRFFQLERAAFFPKPVQRPHPPIWIGGGSEAALRRVGRHGDGWIAVPRPLDDISKGLDVVRREAERAGRDPGRIGAATSGGARSVRELLDSLPRLARAGVTIANVPVLFWARELSEALDMLEDFADRAGLAVE